MKLIQPKYILGTLSIAVIAIWGYTTIINTDRADEGVKLADTVMVSSETVERDTAKRLESLGNSGNILTVSPFGSGKPLAEEPKPKFQKPNTEWKSRTINGITYRFGEGNPAEVALPESEMKGCSWQEGGDYCTDKGAGYVDAELEKVLLEMFNLPNWEQVTTHCEKEFRDTDRERAKLDQPETFGIHFETILDLSSFITIEELIVVNPETGRKNISKLGYQKLMFMRNYFMESTWYTHSNDVMQPDVNYSNCVDIYGTPIINALTNIRSLPWRGAKGEGGIADELIPLNQPILY